MKHSLMMLMALVIWQGTIALPFNEGAGTYRVVSCDDESIEVEKRMVTTDALGNTGTTWMGATGDSYFDEVRPLILEQVIRKLLEEQRRSQEKRNEMPPLAPPYTGAKK